MKDKYLNKKIVLFVAILSFAIPVHYSLAISILTDAPIGVGARSANLRGYVMPQGIEPTVYFKYAESSLAPSACSMNTTAWQKTSSVFLLASVFGTNTFGMLPFYKAIYGLKPETDYKFCAVGTNSTGAIAYGQIRSFKTTKLFGISPIYSPGNYNSLLSEEKTAYIAKPTDITETSARLSASLNPEGKDFSGYFRYSSKMSFPPVFCNDIYGSNMYSTKEVPLGNGNSSVIFKATISDLEPDTKYYYCAVGSSKNSIIYSSVGTFTTKVSSAEEMSVTTDGALVVDSRSAYLNGSFNTLVPANTWFEYRKMDYQNSSLDKQNTKNKNSGEYSWSGKIGETKHTGENTGNINYLLKNLSANTTYQFRAAIRGNSNLDTIYGETLVFKTLGNETASSGSYNTGSGTYNNSGGGENLSLGQNAVPPVDAVVHYHEGIEHVLVRQIMSNPTLARRYGYQDGMNLSTFAWDTAHFFAQIFGYVASDGKEIRVSTPDIAAYRLELKNGDLFVYEYYNGVIIHIQSMTEILREKYGYEYYWQK